MQDFDYSYYEDCWINIRSKIMNEFGYTEGDLSNEDIEDEVNRETDEEFFDQFGFDFADITD